MLTALAYMTPWHANRDDVTAIKLILHFLMVFKSLSSPPKMTFEDLLPQVRTTDAHRKRNHFLLTKNTL